MAEPAKLLARRYPRRRPFTAPTRLDRIAAIAFALGAGDPGRDRDWNAMAAIDAIRALRADVGLDLALADFGGAATDFPALAADALDDEVLANAPRQPDVADIEGLLAAAGPSGAR